MSLKSELQQLANAVAKAYRAHDAAACAAFFTQNGELHSPFGPPARGRAQIEALHRIWTEGQNEKRFEIMDVGQSGELGWALVSFAEGSVTGEGTALWVVEKHGEEGWLIRMCSLHENAPPAIDGSGLP